MDHPLSFGSYNFFSTYDPQVHTISYATRPRESYQGLPFGTGSTGAMVWAEDLLNLQLTRGDTWAPDGSLPSLLRLRIKYTDHHEEIENTTSTLYTDKAIITIIHSFSDGEVSFTLYAHRDDDFIEIIIEDKRSICRPISILPHSWRSSVQPLVKDSMAIHYEYNRFSAYTTINEQTSVLDDSHDPLLGRIYGTAIAVSGNSCISPLCPGFNCSPSRYIRVGIICRCMHTDEKNFLHHICDAMKKSLSQSTETHAQKDAQFWDNYWKTSFITVSKESTMVPLVASWRMNRFLNACSMESSFPPKFNGSLFLHDFDNRYWGGPYWFQNTRLQYWPLLKSGDSHYMKKFFALYCNAAPFQEKRIEATEKHTGVIYPETMHFWGAPRMEDVHAGKLSNPYIIGYMSSSLELLWMMITWIDYQQEMPDSSFLQSLVNLGGAIITFFLNHFPLTSHTLYFSHVSALETWWDVDNPAELIAALTAILPPLSHLAHKIHSPHEELFRNTLKIVPPLPKGSFVYDSTHKSITLSSIGNRYIPASLIRHPTKENYEDPELYAIWPYGLLGNNTETYDEAVETFHRRIHQEPCYGWSQTSIWATRLALTQEAKDLALSHFSYSAKYPGGMHISPGYMLKEAPSVSDCPYFDSPGVLAYTLQEMLLQDHGNENKILPAWPTDEPVSFRLLSKTGWVEYATDNQ